MLLFVGTAAFAQQSAKYTHYMFNRFAINPASAGWQEAWSATGIYRNQWAGFSPDGNGPATFGASVNGALNSIRSGVGLSIVSDKLVTESNTNVALSYAYRQPLGPDATLSFGISGGIAQKTIDGTKLVAQDANDFSIPSTKLNKTALDLGFGVYYQSPKFWAGISSTTLNAAKLQFAGNVNYQQARTIYAMGGTSIGVTEGIKILPSVLVKSDTKKSQVDVNARALFNDKFWGGLQYSTGSELSIMIGAYALGTEEGKPNLAIGYAYGFSTGAFAGANNGVHEIMLQYNLPIKITKRPPVIISDPLFL